MPGPGECPSEGGQDHFRHGECHGEGLSQHPTFKLLPKTQSHVSALLLPSPQVYDFESSKRNNLIFYGLASEDGEVE